MTLRTAFTAVCLLIGVVGAGVSHWVGGVGFVLAAAALVWVVRAGDLEQVADRTSSTQPNMRVYTALVLFVAAIIAVLGVSLLAAS